jgi:hypothetical protein
MHRATAAGLALLCSGLLSSTLLPDLVPKAQAQLAARPPDGTRMVVIEPSVVSADLSNPQKIDPADAHRHAVFAGWIMAPGVEVELVEHTDPIVASAYRQAPMAVYGNPWIYVRVVSSLVPAQIGRKGWVHKDTLSLNTAPRPLWVMGARALRPSLVCDEEPVRPSTACSFHAPANTMVQVSACSPRRAHVRFFAKDGRYIQGYVLRSQLSEGACQGAPPAIDPEIERTRRQGHPGLTLEQQEEHRQALLSTSMEIYAAQAYVCDTSAAARTGGACPGGLVLARGDRLRVFGDMPVDGVWRCEVGRKNNKTMGFIAAAAVNDFPSTEDEEPNRKRMRVIPDAERLILRQLRIEDLLNSPEKDQLKGKILVLRLGSSELYDLDADGGVLSFMIDVSEAPMRFVFRSRQLAELWASGRKSYSCSRLFCDSIAFNARFTAKSFDTVDADGNLRRSPVYEILEMADRFGYYSADAEEQKRGKAAAKVSRGR